MAGLVPAIHDLTKEDVDARHKAGHDDGILSLTSNSNPKDSHQWPKYSCSTIPPTVTEAMANAVAEGARKAGASVDVKRVPELVPEAVAKASYYKLDQVAPIAGIEDLANYDAIIVGTGTRFGRMASQMANFLDQAGGLWAKGALHGKVGGAFTAAATQHGGQETTLFSVITNLLHFGMTIVGLNYGFAGQMKLDEVTGGAPYDATTITGGDGSRQPSENELAGARYQGRVIAETASKLHG
jgi:NAD(P)H dehydrogenase (quinone)